MKIMYVHGFGSSFDPQSDKIVTLSQLGEVVGMSYDYTAHPADTASHLVDFALEQMPDVIVGTSLGGWYAAEVGALTGIPVVLINPAVTPSKTLRKYLGTNEDWYGNIYTLTEGVVDAYSAINLNACALVAVDKDDEVISAAATASVLEGTYNVVAFNGGSHRFDHMAELLPMITKHVETAAIVYG